MNLNIKHRLPKSFMSRPVNVAIIGAGGNGAQFVNGLARLHMSLRALGHPEGFKVRLYDPDVVSDANIGRQLFSSSDVGQPKSFVVVNRLNAFFGLNWTGIHGKWGEDGISSRLYNDEEKIPDFVVGCVDSMASRRQIESHCAKSHARYWLDMGNEASTGQVILGEPETAWKEKDAEGDYNTWGRNRKNKRSAPRLPTVMDLFPHMRKKVKEDDAPSCSLAGALQRQDLFVNQTVATFALNLLWRFFRQGGLEHHGSFINLDTGSVNALPIDQDGWQRFGYYSSTIAPLRRIKKVLHPIRPFNPGQFLLVCGHTVEGHGRYKVRCPQCQAAGLK